MRLYDYGMFYVVAETLAAARDILEEDHGPRGPLKWIPDKQLVRMTFDGEHSHLFPAAQVARENGPGLIHEW